MADARSSHPDPEFIVVDIEATGSELARHCLIELGAVRAAAPDEHFHCFVQPREGAEVSKWVEENIPHVVAAAEAEGLPPVEAARKLARWVKRAAGKRPAVMVAYVMGLDWRAVCDLFERAGVKNPFHYKPVDIYALAMGGLGLPWGFSREQLDGFLGVALMDESDQHNALLDAQQHTIEFNALRAVLGPRWKAVRDGIPPDDA